MGNTTFEYESKKAHYFLNKHVQCSPSLVKTCTNSPLDVLVLFTAFCAMKIDFESIPQ